MSLRLYIDRGEQPFTCVYSRFPVRIGRGTEAECRLEVTYISRVHASIHLVEGRLLLQDEGSRTGTWVHDRSRRLQSGARVDLSTVGNEFYVGPDVHVRVEYEEEEPTVQRTDPAIVVTVREGGGVVHTTCYEDSDVDPQALDAEAVESLLLEALADYRRSSEYLAKVLTQAAGCSPEHVKRFAEAVVETDPEWDGRAAVRHFVTLSGIRPSPSRVDTTALAALQELAASYVPYAPALSSVEAVTDFAFRLDTVLSLLLEGIASIRYAVEHEAGATATTPIRKDLGACLLDWTNDGGYMHRLREEIRFILGHHRLLVDEVLDRVARMIEYLSPAAIEKDPACQGKWWKGQQRARWAEFKLRHQELARLRERALGPVFGKAARALKGSEADRSASVRELPLATSPKLALT